jgi:hypothetical protein
MNYLKEPLLSRPPVAVAAAAAAAPIQNQVSQLNDITSKIRMLIPEIPSEIDMQHSEIIQLLFGIFSRISLALDNKTLTEREANTLYQLIAGINIGDESRVNHLTRRQIKIFADIFKESSEGTARDLDLLTTMLEQTSGTFGFDDLTSPKIQQVVDGLESATLPLERIIDSEKAVAAMIRLCRFLNNLGVQTNKCNDFKSRLARGFLLTGAPINMNSVDRMSQERINLDQITEADFTAVIEEINKDADEEAKRQKHESEVWKARSMFHKGGRGNMQKKKSQSKKYKPKNTRKSKYKCSKKNKQINK